MTRVMQGIPTKEVVRITNKVLGTNYKNYKEIESYMFPAKERMHAAWTKGLTEGQFDFTVYDDPDYVYEGLHCYEKSKQCVGGTLAWFKNGKVSRGPAFPGGEIKFLDIHNGIGLTTVHLAKNGFDVESYNTCVPQIEFMQVAARDLLGKEIVNHTELPKKQYDCVMSFEVLEHYTDPLVHVNELLNLIKPGGYLAESSGFNGSSIIIGHFDTYTIGGKEVSFREARRITTKEIQKHFELRYDGFNRMPKIWQRISAE